MHAEPTDGPVVQRIEWEFPKLLIQVRFLAGLLNTTMYYTYVIQSDLHAKRYKGCCSDLEKRLHEHNAGLTKSTKAFIPWRIVYFEVFGTFAEARVREKYFKTAAGRRFINNKIGPLSI